MTASRVREVATPNGPARVRLTRPRGAVGTVVLTHGASGGLGSPDLRALETQLPQLGWAVALVEQAFVVAGERTPPRPPVQDTAWLAVIAALRSGRAALPGLLVVGGRSNGARVGCRTAVASGADAVLCLAFPLHPPGRPDTSRAGELLIPYAAGLAVRVVQGERDAFGSPEEVRAVVPDPATVVTVAGTHSFTRVPGDVVAAVMAFLGECRQAAGR